MTTNPNTIDFEALITKHPWIVERDQNCVLSPDSDGLLCGLLMSHYLGWHIRGFYDGKVLLLEKGFNPQGCVFLDMEIFRKEVRSIGQHIVHYNVLRPNPHWEELAQAISANDLRGFDYAGSNFRNKYPLATIHLLLAIIGQRVQISLGPRAVEPLLYADGTFKNLFNYIENALSWLKFLHADNPDSPLNSIFHREELSLMGAMQAVGQFFKDISAIGMRADKIVISNRQGEMVNVTSAGVLDKSIRQCAEDFLGLLAERTGWSYTSNNWTWTNYSVRVFEKCAEVPSLGRYNAAMARRPISLSITSRIGESMQYTIDPENSF